MKSVTQSGKSAFSDLEILYNSYFTQRKPSSEMKAKAEANIFEAFGLRGLELMIIAYIAHLPNHVHGLACKMLPKILTISDTDYVMEVVMSLVGKGFLALETLAGGTNYVHLTEATVEAFCDGKIQSIDFIDMLRKVTSEQMTNSKWVQTFRKAIKISFLSSFAQGWKSLKADELTDEETLNFCSTIIQFINHFTEPLADDSGIDFARLLRGDINDSVPNSVSMDSLVQKGLVVAGERGYIITPKVAETLLHGHDEIVNYNEISKLSTVIICSDIERKKLYYPAELKQSIERLLINLSRDGFETAKMKLRENKRNPAIMSLFYGGPGTGKTETVKQIALQTERDIFLFDISNVIDPYVGVTEKNYKKLLSTYRYIVAVKKQTPILFFNEADQALSKRLDSMSSSIDKMENSVSNMLLQAFEDMHGILFATTNNVELLDSAFNRRFLYKIKLQGTVADTRKSIWKDKVPELSEEEAEYLANKFNMSGSEIDNVVIKRELDILTHECNKGLGYIETLCREELAIDKTSMPKCGF